MKIPPKDLCDGIASVLDQLRRSQILFDKQESIFWRIWNEAIKKNITLAKGMGHTTPDAVFEDDGEEITIAIYEDGMSIGLHGNPSTAERDRFLREALRSQGWEILEVTNHDLDDAPTMTRHFKKLSR